MYKKAWCTFKVVVLPTTFCEPIVFIAIVFDVTVVISLVHFSKTGKFWSSKANWRLCFSLPSIVLMDLLETKLYFNEFKRSGLWFRIGGFQSFLCFSVSRFFACDRNYDWQQWKTQLLRYLLNLRVCMFVKSAVVNGGRQGSNLCTCHSMDHSRGALVALGRPHRIDWGNNEQMHVKLTMEPNPKTEGLRPKGLQLNERFWGGARLLHSRSGVAYMHLVFSRTVSSSTRNNEIITKGKMLLPLN